MRSTLSQPTLWFNHIVTPNSGFREFELDNAVERLTPHMNLIFLSQTVMSLSENRKPHTENPSITVSFGRDRHVHRVQHVPDVASPVAWILHAASSHSATRIGKIQPAIFHSQLIFQVWRGGSVLVDRSGVGRHEPAEPKLVDPWIAAFVQEARHSIYFAQDIQ